MSKNLRPVFTHVGLFVNDLEPMVEFYTNVVGQTLSDRGKATTADVDLVFFSNDPNEHHQFVLVSGRPDDVNFGLCHQVSFLVEDMEDLRIMYERAVARGVPNIKPVSHGNAYSVYFDDPEGNMVEVYMHSEWHVPQPHYRPIDFTKSDEEILAENEAICRKDPGFSTVRDRKAEMENRIAGPA
jgi:catechol 2,3-dioxygenase